ncbi:MAG: hypothetical protein JWQ23_2198 [Herminiimonas sp.]|nr:hypothetical protein [Herminiimonas sp.]
MAQSGYDTVMDFGEKQLECLPADARAMVGELEEQIQRLKTRINSWQANGLSLLSQAASTGNLDAVIRLDAMGANLRQHDAHGDPPIFAAARAGQWAIVLWLLRKGASVNQSNGNTGDRVQIYTGDPALSGRAREEILAHVIDSARSSYLEDETLSAVEKFGRFAIRVEAAERMAATHTNPAAEMHTALT